ncbi:unnamed protein product [Symbiodinium sp. CCMP2592]|nr:unnamed protein product [Symbiodinium sp. CCMP2592]
MIIEDETQQTEGYSVDDMGFTVENTGYSPDLPWGSMKTLPLDPPFDLSADPLLKPIEFRALLLLRHPKPPTPRDVFNLFNMIPNTYLRRGAKDGTRYFGTGSNPRNSKCLFSFSIEMPFTTLVITKMIAYVAPSFRFTCCILFRGCKSRPHRDANNGGNQSLVMQISPPLPGAALWVQDICGDVIMEHLGTRVKGRVVSIDTPYLLNARKCLHAGYVPPHVDPQQRVVLVAFNTINLGTLSPEVIDQLLDLGFRINSKTDLKEALEEAPRFKQLTLQEFLQLPPSRKDCHDVIEVMDSQDE